MAKQDDWQSQFSIIIPAFNEAEGIKKVLIELNQAIPEAEIIVVDDGSKDGTGDAVRNSGFNVVLLTHTFNFGYGAALKTGMRESSRDYIAWFDADNEHRVEDLVSMARLATNKKLAAVIAARKNSDPFTVRSFGKMMIRGLCRILKSDIGDDINCGLRVFRREVIERYYSLLPERYSASLVSTLLIIERQYPFEFYPVVTNARIGTSKIVLKDGFEAILLSLGMILLFAPMRFFLSTGLMFVLLGSIYSLYFLITVTAGIPAAGVIIIIAGLMSISLGLLADQIRQIRLNQLPEMAYYQRESAGTSEGASDN